VTQSWLFRPLENPVHIYGDLIARNLLEKNCNADVSSLPLQLALVVLRLTQYSPSILLRYLPLFEKKIPQLTTSRLLHNIQVELHRVTRWPSLPPAVASFLARKISPKRPGHSDNQRLFADMPLPTADMRPLSKSEIWSAQKAFYRQQGIGAWSANLVPYGVSSSMFIAEAYARTVQT
jgi:hypothetical protein